MIVHRLSPRVPVALGVIALLAACTENPMSPAAGPASFHLIPATVPDVEYAVLCKAGPPGTYTFSATATKPVLVNVTTGAHDLSAATYSITVTPTSTVDGTTTPGACLSYTTGGVHNHNALAGGTVDATITVVESVIPTGVVFVKAETYQLTRIGGVDQPLDMQTTTVNSASVRIGGDAASPRTLWGGTIIFYNEPAPPPPPETWRGETAVGAGYPWKLTQGAPSNWFMYTPWVTTNGFTGISATGGANLIAGQFYLAGKITGTRTSAANSTAITITLNPGFRFTNIANNVKIQPMSCAANQPYVQPGQFTKKVSALQTATSITVTGLANTACYGVHVDVERLLP